MGSVIVILSSLPACLFDARQQSLVRHLPETDSAQSEVSVESSRPAANLTPVSLSYQKLSFSVVLDYHAFLSHLSSVIF
jgi:hypothetical protein